MANLLDAGGRVGEASATSAGEGNPFWRNGQGGRSQKETSLEPSEFDFEYIDVMDSWHLHLKRDWKQTRGFRDHLRKSNS